MATKKMTPTKTLTAQQKRDREFMQITANLIAQRDEEQRRTNNEHYSLGNKEGWEQAEYHYSRLSLVERILKRW